MFDTHLNRIEDSTLWACRDPALQYALQTTQTSNQCFPDFSLYGAQHPELVPSPLISPRLDRDYHSRRPSLAYSFGEQSFDGNLATPDSQFSTADIAGDYFPFLDLPRLEDMRDDDSTNLPHPEPSFQSSSLPSPPMSTQQPRPTSFQYHTHTFYAGTSPTPSSTSAPSPTHSIKKTHNEVERGYRNRLNDKIDALAQQVFKANISDPIKRRSRPPKCLVISRAKQRLEELESQNERLESEVEKLKRKVAVLDHLLAESRGEGDGLGPG